MRTATVLQKSEAKTRSLLGIEKNDVSVYMIFGATDAVGSSV